METTPKGKKPNLKCCICYSPDVVASIDTPRGEFCLCEKHKKEFEKYDTYDIESVQAALIDMSDKNWEEEEREQLRANIESWTPHKIKDYLDERVIGQDRAKKILASAVYNHYLRVINNVEDDKSNILMVGPSGVGKTEIARNLAKIMKVPFVICDATTVTEAGYVGDDVENILLRLYQASDENIKQTEMGIIFLDEIDKIARKGESTSITRDVSGEGVQQALLKIVEGAEVDVPVNGGRKHPQGDRIKVNTKNILFICSGAFEGLTMHNNKKNSLGFCSSESDDKEYNAERIDAEDIKKQGIIPELVGRLPVMVGLKALTVEDLERILVEPVNSICKKYERLFSLNGVKLTFSKEALKEIAKEAYDKGTGARGLRSIVEDTLADTMFDMPSDKSIIGATVKVKGKDKKELYVALKRKTESKEK